MIKIVCILMLSLSTIVSAEQTDDFKKLLEEYKSNYNFYSIKDTLYTIQTEYQLPENYEYAKYKEKSSYASWISNFPIWHQYKSVGNWKGSKHFNYDEVSRVVHLPWQGPAFKSVGIPVRLLGEYYFQFNKRFSFEIIPQGGEILTYTKWLNGKPAYNHRKEVLFKDDILKEDTESEYYRYLLFCMQNVSYESIANSCDSVLSSEVQAGDMYIGYDATGKKGKLFVVLRLIKSDSGDILYLVANGCPDACDFHIPNINSDRQNPWIKIEQLQDLTSEFNNSTFYRFKTR